MERTWPLGSWQLSGLAFQGNIKVSLGFRKPFILRSLTEQPITLFSLQGFKTRKITNNLCFNGLGRLGLRYIARAYLTNIFLG